MASMMEAKPESTFDLERSVKVAQAVLLVLPAYDFNSLEYREHFRLAAETVANEELTKPDDIQLREANAIKLIQAEFGRSYAEKPPRRRTHNELQKERKSIIYLYTQAKQFAYENQDSLRSWSTGEENDEKTAFSRIVLSGLLPYTPQVLLTYLYMRIS